MNALHIYDMRDDIYTESPRQGFLFDVFYSSAKANGIYPAIAEERSVCAIR